MTVFYFIIRKLIALLLGCVVAAPPLSYNFTPPQEMGDYIKVMSFNVYISGTGKRSPENRSALVTQTIRNEMPDSFGLQEADLAWVERVSAAMPEYTYVGVGREDGAEEGEFSPVFYLKDKYTLINSGTFWFSPTPDEPSHGWDAACRRICSWAILENKESGERYAHFNAHMDHVGTISRSNSADLLLERAEEYADGLPTIFTGDFNCDEGSTPYEKIIEGGFMDCKYVAEDTMSLGTWHNFGANQMENRSPIDFVFATYARACVKSYRVITEKINDEYPSDHYPVVCELAFTQEEMEEEIRVMSFNVLCWGDEYNLFKRIEPVTQTIEKAAPDVFGVQEATGTWMNMLNAEYEGVYASVGKGRMGGNIGEHSAIFYRIDKFNLIESGTFWLSNTPERPSKLENSKHPRICTYAVLEAKVSGKRFAVLNTHLDYADIDAIKEQACMVLDKADEFDIPVALTGDYNVDPKSIVYSEVMNRGYLDSRSTAAESDAAGTYNGLREDVSKAQIIDYVFYKGFKAQRFNVMDELSANGRYASDHFAIYADLSL